jgi:hypothetical protein
MTCSLIALSFNPNIFDFGKIKHVFLNQTHTCKIWGEKKLHFSLYAGALLNLSTRVNDQIKQKENVTFESVQRNDGVRVIDDNRITNYIDN